MPKWRMWTDARESGAWWTDARPARSWSWGSLGADLALWLIWAVVAALVLS